MRYIRNFLIVASILLFGTLAVLPAAASAQRPQDCPDGDISQCPGAPPTGTETCSGGSWFLGFPTWYKYLEFERDDTGKCSVVGPRDAENANQIDWEQASGLIAIAIVEMLLRVATLVAVGYVMYGGFRYITSQGEPESAKSARQTIINAMIGLVVSLVAAALVSFIANAIT